MMPVLPSTAGRHTLAGSTETPRRASGDALANAHERDADGEFCYLDFDGSLSYRLLLERIGAHVELWAMTGVMYVLDVRTTAGGRGDAFEMRGAELDVVRVLTSARCSGTG